MGGLLKSDGYLKFKDYGQLTTPDFTTKDVQIGFGYSNSDDGSGFAGLFLSVSNGSARFQINLKSATKPLNVLIAFTRPLITEFADNLNLKHPLLPTISPYPTM